jgi:CubicO group peptidase (beta-lactamase class C family)
MQTLRNKSYALKLRHVKMYEEEVVEGEVGARANEYLTRIIPFGFSGAASVTKQGKILLNKGYGMAIREKNICNTSQTVFCTGSITKQFTATAILKLEMQGKLKTNDPITKHFNNVPKDKTSITIHNLLTHTAGIIDNVGDDYEIVNRNETVQKILKTPLLFVPGEQYDYSNAGYSLLGAIIEIVSGQQYETCLNEQLFKTSGMKYTGYRLPKWNGKIVANWYMGDVDNENSLCRPFPYWNLVGNGGILSTLEDLHRWYLSLKNNVVLSTEAKKKLFTPFLQNYAYGWIVTTTQHGTLIHHDGGNELGTSADFKWFPDCDTVIIMFFNQSYEHTPIMQQVRDKIEKLVFGEAVPMPPKVLETDRYDLERFIGEYQFKTGGKFSVAVETNAIKIAADRQDAINALFSNGQDNPFHCSELNNKTMMLLQAAVKGEFSYLEEEVEDKITLERKKRFISNTIQKAELVGSFKEIEIIGTLPFSRKEGVEITFAHLDYGNEKIAIGFGWHNGKLWGVTPQPDHPIMLFNPLSKRTFAGYHIGLAKNSKISFNTNSTDSVIELVIHRKDINIKARKLKNKGRQ